MDEVEKLQEGTVDMELPPPPDVADKRHPANPHKLPLQVLGVLVSSVLIALIGGLLVVPAGILAFADAWKAGLFKQEGSQSFLNMSPMSWGIAMEWLFIVAYPLYMIFRHRLRTKTGSTVLFILTAAYGAIPLLALLLRILMATTGVRPAV